MSSKPFKRLSTANQAKVIAALAQQDASFLLNAIRIILMTSQPRPNQAPVDQVSLDHALENIMAALELKNPEAYKEWTDAEYGSDEEQLAAGARLFARKRRR